MIKIALLFIIRRGFYKLACFTKYTLLTLIWLGFNLTIYAQSVPDLLIVQVPDQQKFIYSAANIQQIKTDHYVAHARIVLLGLSPSKSKNLTTEFYAACDPDVSFDGKSIIFSGIKDKEDHWQIWQMNIDGTQLRQITDSAGDCITPVYAGNRFYLDDPQPTPQIIYAGKTHNLNNLRKSEPVYSLYGMDTEGKNIHRLTFNLNSDFSPDVLPNGRIAFVSWQTSGGGYQAGGKYAFMAVNNDGTDLMPYYGNHQTPLYKDMIHISDFDQRIYFIESDRLFWLGGGDLCYLSQRRPLHSYKKLSSAQNGLFHSPCPLPDGGLLAAYRDISKREMFALYLINTETGKIIKKIYEEPGWHCVDPQVIKAHPKVKGRSNWLIPGAETGIFYCLDSYHTNLSELGDPEHGTVKYIRVIEGISPVKNLTISDNQDDTKENAISDTNFTPIHGSNRILGVAPVEADGSFQIRIPAETPLNFQLLDKNYMAIRSQKAWTWVMGNENRGCIGCHEDPESSPPNIMVDAVIKPPIELTLPSERRRKVDFLNQIVPLIQSKCATENCHISPKVTPNFNGVKDNTNVNILRHIYKVLLNPVKKRKWERYVIPGNAKESPLIWHIFGKRMKSDKDVTDDDIRLLSGNNSLNQRDKILLVEWIDLGAYWDYQE